jgi:Icc-related predicted phosphoesterase
MDFNYAHLRELDPLNHCFVPGNHDNYHALPAHALEGTHGICKLGDFEFMYVRGALSVDKHHRLIDVSWWEEEEMMYEDGLKTIAFALKNKPKVILSHDCPFSVYDRVVTNEYKLVGSRTATILQSIFELHQPDLWVFGHHHKDIKFEVDGTTFICLNELSYLDYPDLTINKFI